MNKVNIREAMIRLMWLIQNVLAGVEAVLSRSIKPLVKPKVEVKTHAKRKLGSAAGKVRFAVDFDGQMDEFKDYRS